MAAKWLNSWTTFSPVPSTKARSPAPPAQRWASQARLGGRPNGGRAAAPAPGRARPGGGGGKTEGGAGQRRGGVGRKGESAVAVGGVVVPRIVHRNEGVEEVVAPRQMDEDGAGNAGGRVAGRGRR